jgi:hypothetical protein
MNLSVRKSGGSSSDMSSVSDGNEVPVQMATNTFTKSFRKNKILCRELKSSDSEDSSNEESRSGKS